MNSKRVKDKALNIQCPMYTVQQLILRPTWSKRDTSSLLNSDTYTSHELGLTRITVHDQELALVNHQLASNNTRENQMKMSNEHGLWQ